MKLMRKVTFMIILIFGAGFLFHSSLVTFQSNDDSFMAESPVKFLKRLDELNGEVVETRRVASISLNFLGSEKRLAPNPHKVDFKKRSVKTASVSNQVKTTQAAPVRFEKKSQVQAPGQSSEVASETAIIEPTIKENLVLTLTNIFYKKSLEGEFYGEAITSNGVLEAVHVELPDGNTIEINTHEQMTGNVFRYEDPETRDVKSGMMYKVKDNEYIITLTNLSKYPGIRLTMKTLDDKRVAEVPEAYELETEEENFSAQNQDSELPLGAQDQSEDFYQ